MDHPNKKYYKELRAKVSSEEFGFWCCKILTELVDAIEEAEVQGIRPPYRCPKNRKKGNDTCNCQCKLWRVCLVKSSCRTMFSDIGQELIDAMC